MDEEKRQIKAQIRVGRELREKKNKEKIKVENGLGEKEKFNLG